MHTLIKQFDAIDRKQALPFGTELNNGAVVIHTENNQVLANYNGEFVVWTYHVENNKICTYWGHYFANDFNEASAYFKKACEAND